MLKDMTGNIKWDQLLPRAVHNRKCVAYLIQQQFIGIPIYMDGITLNNNIYRTFQNRV